MSAVAVVLSWNGREATLACLRSLSAVEGLDVLVVDNASRDGSAEAVAAEFPDVRLVRNERNLGFAGGMNVGLRTALDAGAAEQRHGGRSGLPRAAPRGRLR